MKRNKLKLTTVIPAVSCLIFLTACGESLNSAGLTQMECQQLAEFAKRDLESLPNRDATTNFWNLEQSRKEIDQAVKDSNLVPGSSEYKAWIKVIEDAVEKRRQEIATKAGEYSVTLKDGNLKDAMKDLAQDPNSGNFGTIRGIAVACNLESNN